MLTVPIQNHPAQVGDHGNSKEQRVWPNNLPSCALAGVPQAPRVDVWLFRFNFILLLC